MRLPLSTVVLLGLAGCATLYRSDTPTQVMVEAQLRKTKKVVAFSSTLSSQSIEDGLTKSDCGNETKTFSSITPAGPGMLVGVSTTARYSVERGVLPDDSRWIALRSSSGMSGAPAGVRLVDRADGGTDVSAFAADSRKVDRIKQALEDGTMFCHWREFDYPFD